jgi:hypothetical protein
MHLAPKSKPPAQMETKREIDLSSDTPTQKQTPDSVFMKWFSKRGLTDPRHIPDLSPSSERNSVSRRAVVDLSRTSHEAGISRDQSHHEDLVELVSEDETLCSNTVRDHLSDARNKTEGGDNALASEQNNKTWLCYTIMTPQTSEKKLTYVGITPCLRRRLRQHNREIAGSFETRKILLYH